MRRNYISPEYLYKRVNGTFNMIEKSSFFGSKMIDIEDYISIKSKEILYYQNLNKEQIDFKLESSLLPSVFSSIIEKRTSHTISIDGSQSSSQKSNNTKWNINIPLNVVLSNYIFALLKSSRTFEGVKNEYTLYNDVDVAIKFYISNNIISRYQIDTIDFYVSYNNILTKEVLQYQSTFNPKIESPENLMSRISTTYDYNKSNVLLSFNQEKSSLNYTFDYYFNLNFIKI